jgi:peptidoglycan/xylan/chitin deacetylase (PgdA/CDA1 family)
MFARILNKLERLGNDFVFNSGILASNRLKETEHTILMYHGIDTVGGTDFNSRHTSQVHFFKHVEFLKKYCHIISLADFFEKRFISGKPNIALTFDDGYRNNFLYAKPVLEAAKVNGTFYITGLNTSDTNILWADFLNIASKLTNQTISIDGEKFEQRNGVYHSLDSGKNLYSIIKDEKAGSDYKQLMTESFIDLYDFKKDLAYDDYWKLMTDQEIRKCGESKFVEVGSHGFLHNNLGTISIEDANVELQNSKSYLENIIQNNVVSIGYPDGSYTGETLNASENLGFLYQTAAEGFLFKEDETDNRIRDRKGMYTCDTCANQLLINL